MNQPLREGEFLTHGTDYTKSKKVRGIHDTLKKTVAKFLVEEW